MATPEVRDAVREDAEAVARVRYESWQVAYRGLLPRDVLRSLNLDGWIAHAQELLTPPTRPDLHQLVSTDGRGRVVAMASCGDAREPPEGVTGELYAIYAHPDAWGEGHGHALIEEVHRRLAGDGHERAMLWVAAGNDRTIAWYERHGWALDGTTKRDDVMGVAFDEARMVRDLTGAGQR